jgi:predicted nucleic acid-binding protein
MEIISDASVFLAVILNESERTWVAEKTCGATIVSPEILPYEIGNALIALMKRKLLSGREIVKAFELSQKIGVRLVTVDIPRALDIAVRFNIYAYDAYYLQCCIENRMPLISLDSRMCGVARELHIKVVE